MVSVEVHTFQMTPAQVKLTTKQKFFFHLQCLSRKDHFKCAVSFLRTCARQSSLKDGPSQLLLLSPYPPATVGPAKLYGMQYRMTSVWPTALTHRRQSANVCGRKPALLTPKGNTSNKALPVLE